MNKKNKIDFVEKLTRFIVVNIEMVQEEWQKGCPVNPRRHGLALP